MTDMEYEQMLEEAHAIPILDVASLVIEEYGYHNGKLTGKCPEHEDNKLGNLSFDITRNIARCFTCCTNFTTINLVKACKYLDFKSAILFLYQNFPSSFSKEPDFSKNVDNDNTPTWNGLSNKEYTYLKMSTRLYIHGEVAPITLFATNYPGEHDQMLFSAINNTLIEVINTKNDFLSITSNEKDIDKINKDFDNTCEKLFEYLNRGIMNKDNVPILKEQLLKAI